MGHRAKYLKFAPDPVPLVGRASVPAKGSRFGAECVVPSA
jgi:hypothetical protein